MSSYRVISSDSHVMEPPDLWTSRIAPRFRDRAPHLVEEADGAWWYCEDRKFQSLVGGIQAGSRYDDRDSMRITGSWEEVRRGAYVPEEHVKDLETDGVYAGVIYPTVGLLVFSLPDSQILAAIMAAYNDWLAEFCKPFPHRLKGIGMVNVDDIGEGVRELERCANMGLAGAMISVYPPEEKGYDLPEYDLLWAAAQDLRMPISLHFATNRHGAGTPDFVFHRGRPGFNINVDYYVKVSLAHMILNGVFERFPKLQVGAVEHEISWVPHFLRSMDFYYTQRPPGEVRFQFTEDAVPSDYFHRNVFLSFQEDGVGVRLRDIIGVDQLLWGSDYPHVESTFPRSREVLEEILADCSEEEKAKIAGANAARVYGIE